jgi:hypothetical protein
LGASGWRHFVPYQEDIEAALQQLRHTVFASGDYYRVDHSEYRSMTEDDMRMRLSDLDDEVRDIILDDWRQIKRLKEPSTIEDLLGWNRESGTHSVLDMTRVTAEPEFGTVSPLSADEIREHFGTLQPSHQQVEDWLENDGTSSVRSRWTGLYVIVYESGNPTEICFAGFSGD